MPDLRVGNTQVSNVKVGSTQVSAIYVGSNSVWSNIVLTTSPANGTHGAIVFNTGTATATVAVTANRSVSWSFNLVSGSSAFTTGGTSGTGTYVRLSNSNSPYSSLSSVVDVTATSGGASVTTRVTVTAIVDFDINEGGG